jgi:hypothetical protein
MNKEKRVYKSARGAKFNFLPRQSAREARKEKKRLLANDFL